MKAIKKFIAPQLVSSLLIAFLCTQTIASSFKPTSLSSESYGKCNGERGISVSVPIVKSYEQFREEVQWMDPQPILVNGKIVVYNDYLLINEPDKGIHVYDNIEPENPVALGFINIPGNTDLMVRNDIIYADSLVDLVLISIANIDDVHEVERSLNIYQANPNRFGSFYFPGVSIDSQNEIVIGKDDVCINF